MCGIVGAFAFKNSAFEVTEPYIARMRDRMAHRGPDGAGAWISDDHRIGLGHRRLSIIDLSKCADQPMCNEDGSLWVVFNGEIYNHADIRAELEAFATHRWKTDHSDTEVILHAFEQWGIDCIHRFRGMFAIALWDGRNRELWLIRDRIGVKPLAYSVHHGRIVFASEMKALLADPEQQRAVNEESFYHYLSFLTTPAPDTLFEGIRKLPGGTWLRISEDGQIVEHRYWDVWDHTTPLVGVSEEEIAERLLEELRIAVKLRKVSDVPVGVFLSGGIDSSTNAALFSEGDDQAVRTFSIGYDCDYKSYPSELPFARQMAKLVGADHHELLLNQDDLIEFIPTMIRLQDEPIADPVCVPVYYVSKLARDNGVIVCQLGEGSDELFWGYPQWQLRLRVQQWDDLPVPRTFKRLGLALLRRMELDEATPYEWLRRGAAGQPIFWSGAEAFTEVHKKRLISPRLRRRFRDLTSWQALIPTRRRFEENAWEPSHLNWMTYMDLNLRLPELLLMRVDKMSMGVSLEGRVPFLDHKFCEFAMSIPTAVKTGGGELKHILKKAVRGLIPNELIDRKKQGFGVPVYEWFTDKLGNYARRELSSFCEQTDFLDQSAVLRLVQNPECGSQAWFLLNFVLWWKEYIQGTPRSGSTVNGIGTAEPVAEARSTN
jgi:asparagine synthase (glutamine-hydrolysing)